jgi:lipid-A-disaccharide synthase
MRFLISAGDASGELYGAQLIHALRERVPDAQFFGLGGERMRAAGCELTVHAKDVAVLGMVEILTHLPRLYAEFNNLIRAVDAQKPDACIIIDFPGFNLRVARALHARGVPVIYYVAPQFWAWRPWRVRHIRRWVDKALVIFPFEEQWYRERGVPAEYVGHPLTDEPMPTIAREQFAQENGLDPHKQWIALLPGSRRKEFRMNLSPLVATTQRLGGSDHYEFLLPVANTLDPKWAAAEIDRQTGRQGATHEAVITLLEGDARAALRHARAAVVASGTATVEAALMGTPFVVVYRVSPLTYLLGRPLVRVPYFAMVNLIAEHEAVPELVQRDFTAERVSQELGPLISGGEKRERMVAELAQLAEKLHSPGLAGTAAGRAAEAVLALLKRGSSG